MHQIYYKFVLCLIGVRFLIHSSHIEVCTSYTLNYIFIDGSYNKIFWIYLQKITQSVGNLILSKDFIDEYVHIKICW